MLPFDPKSNKVLLIKQFRIGAYLSGFNPWQIEIIAGCIDKSDLSIENAILRETKEESGLIINKKNLILVHKILNSCFDHKSCLAMLNVKDAANV